MPKTIEVHTDIRWKLSYIFILSILCTLIHKITKMLNSKEFCHTATPIGCLFLTQFIALVGAIRLTSAVIQMWRNLNRNRE